MERSVSEFVEIFGLSTMTTFEPTHKVTGSDHLLNSSPNIGRPLCDPCLVTSSSITSQCSASIPFSMRTISAAIQFAGRPKLRKSSVHHDEIPFSHNRSMLIFEGRRKALNQIEHALAPRRNVRAMLDVVR